MNTSKSKWDTVNFVNMVLNIFNFLNKDYEYCVTKTETKDILSVTYKNDLVFVTLYYEVYGAEIGLKIGQMQKNGISTEYGLEDILEYKGIKNEKVFFQSTNESGVMFSLQKLADLVKNYAMEFIRGEKSSYENLKKWVFSRSLELTRSQIIDKKRKEAHQAWENKDYPKCVGLYSSIVKELTPVELKRLEIAKNK
ncbi:MAG: hypothetical protein A2252_04195 [Elusimicrobia bacterium RIFOXYA2_FULL_39_19]|nr:MAG: hypothetical protein A2252_04195 [Elusimicrobia bacterium RIFOXYA2_FULL_39_19]